MTRTISEMEKELGRNKPGATSTAYGEWLRDKLKSTKTPLKRLAVAVGADYSYLWKIIQCKPEQYPTNIRTGHELTVAIGEYFGDVAEALEAAGYEIPEPTATPEESEFVRAMLNATPEQKALIRAMLESWGLGIGVEEL